MAGFDIAGRQVMPDFVGTAREGLAAGRQMRLDREADHKRNLLTGLAPQIIAGEPGAFDRAAAIDPEAAGKYQAAGDNQLRRLKGAIDYIDKAKQSGNPQAVEMAYQQVRPYLARFGQEPPATFAEAADKFEAAKARIAMLDGSGTELKSLRVGADGFYYAIQGGQLVNTGIKADPRTVLRDQPGIEPGLVDLRSGQVSPLGTSPAPSRAPSGEVPFSIDPSLPAPVQAAIRANPDQFASAPDGATITVPGMPPSGVAATRPAVSPAEAERLRLASEANRRAEEANQRAAEAARNAARGNAPAGFRFKADGTLEPIPGGPKPAGAAATEDERKAAGWVNQARFAQQNMEAALGDDPEANDPGFIETYSPIDELANWSRSDARQRYVQAASSFSEAVLRAATGAGVNRDEAIQKVRELTPQRGDSAGVREQKRRALDVYLQSLEQRAGRALRPAESSGGRYQVGQVIEAGGKRYRVTGGDMNDPDVEEVR